MGAEKTFNLADLLNIVVETVPHDREALVCGSNRVTYREFWNRICRIAQWMRSRGIGTNDTVGIHSHNRLEFVETVFAAYLIKAIPVNINYRYTYSEAHYIYDNAQLKALFYGDNEESCVVQALVGLPSRPILVRFGGGACLIEDAVPFAEALYVASSSLDDVVRSDNDLSMLYTGGTTGMPKGVMWQHKDLFFAALGGGGSLGTAGPISRPEELADRVRSTYALRMLPFSPLIHGNGMWVTSIGLFAGCTVVLNERPSLLPETILDLIALERINCLNFIGDATMNPLLEAMKENPGRWDLTHVVAVSNGGALLSNHVREALRPYLSPQAVIVNGMGSSETGTVGTGGKPAEGGLLRLPPGPHTAVVVDGTRFAQPGENGILVRLGYMPVGYFRDPAKTAATFITIEGKRCALSGDIAKLETDGSITIFGRDSQCINTGGEKVYTEEVEEALRACDEIKDAVVVGMPDPRWGQKVVGIVSLRPGSPQDADAIRKEIREKLAGYKVPKAILFVENVVRTVSGKADYRWAKETAEAACGGEPA